MSKKVLMAGFLGLVISGSIASFSFAGPQHINHQHLLAQSSDPYTTTSPTQRPVSTTTKTTTHKATTKHMKTGQQPGVYYGGKKKMTHAVSYRTPYGPKYHHKRYHRKHRMIRGYW